MAVAKLTKSLIQELQYEHGGKHLQIIWDAALPSFGVRLYATQAKAYVVKFKRFKRDVIDTVAPVHLMPLDEAREKARRFLVKAYAERSSVLADLREITVSEFCDEYVERYAKLHKKSWKDDRRRCDTIIKLAWGDRCLIDIQRPDVALLVDQVGKETPLKANRLREQLSKMFSCAQLWGYIETSRQNFTKGVPRFDEVQRERWFDESEVRAIIRVLRAEENYFARAAILLLLFTGLRKNECLKMTWAQVNLERMELTIPRQKRKTKQPLVVPLSRAAGDILASLPRYPGNQYVFPGRIAGKPLYDLNGPWDRVRHAANLSNARLHDLRHTVASSLAQNGIDLWLISKVLGHAGIASTMRYAHLSTRQSKEALELFAEKFESSVKDVNVSETSMLCPTYRESSAFGTLTFSAAPQGLLDTERMSYAKD